MVYNSNFVTAREILALILSGLEIRNHIGHEIIIEPFDGSRLNPNSYNLSLHDELLIYTHEELDMRKDNPSEKILIPPEGFV